MPVGGARPGAGRPKGSIGNRKAELRAKLADGGLMPLDYMLQVLRDPAIPVARRDDMAKAAAPYIHARLASVEQTGKDGGPMVVKIVD